MTGFKILILILSVGAAACGGGSTAGGDDVANTPDAAGGGGADSGSSGGSGAGGSVPANITISGTTASAGFSGDTPAANAAVAVFEASGSMLVAGTSDGTGNFSLSVPTGGAAVDGFVKASLSGASDTYLFPSAPLTADDPGVTMELLSTTLISLAAGAGGTTQTSGDGFIGLEVHGAAGAPVAGATITTTAGTIRYASSAGGAPDKNATATAADGHAFIFSIPPGDVTVGASKSGTSFKTHTVKSFADAVTETDVSP